ncbi:MAG: prepilin-type N-terminal cleavage/methylation domain-containing protein [Gemmatimonadetes bacterium]|nr:prepilin-type N-terminal cleavage/methylation domain-containing protein [Gemmatimonadota bacterium]
MTRKTPYLRRFNVVTFLHPVLAGVRARSGFGLPEVIVAVTVFGAGVLGVAALGGAAGKLAHIAAVRSAQTVAAGSTLEHTPADVRGQLEVTVDTVGIVPGLIEIRVTVSGSGSAGARQWVARRSSTGL